MPSQDDIQSELRDFISSDLLNGSATLDSSTSLFESRVLDSLNLIELIDFIEEKYQIKVHPSEVQTTNLDSIERMECFIKNKQSK